MPRYIRISWPCSMPRGCSAAAAGARGTQGARHDPRLGRAHHRARRRQGQRLHRHQRLSGRAPRGRQAEPGGARAHGRPGGGDRRRSRDRLDARAAAGLGQHQDPARQPRLLRGGAAGAPARGALGGRPLDGRHPSARQPARHPRSAQHRDHRQGPGGAPGAAGSGQRCVLRHARRGLPEALEQPRAPSGRPRPPRSRASVVVVIHRDQVYLCNWLGLKELAAIEPKPGVPPSAGYLAELVTKLAATPPKMILRNAYNDPKAADWLAERIHVPVVLLPYTVGRHAGGEGPVRAVRRHHQPAAGGKQVNTLQAELSILWPALIAGVLVVLSHVPLGPAGAGARHRVHRPGDRAGRRARRHRRAQLRSRRYRLDHADCRGRGGTGRGAAAHLDRAQAPRGAGGADRRALRARLDRADPAPGERSARRRGSEGSARRADPVGHARSSCCTRRS